MDPENKLDRLILNSLILIASGIGFIFLGLSTYIS